MALFDVDLRLLDSIGSRMQLRDPNRRALRAVAANIAAASLGSPEMVVRMATGTGKTYVMRALIEYAVAKRVRHVVVVVPGKVVRAKTVGNLTAGAEGFISGGEADYTLITPDNFETQRAASALVDPDEPCVVLMNIDLLSAKDSDDAKSGGAATSRRTNRVNEFLGSTLYDHLRDADDLLLIADECHLYTSPSYSASLDRLKPAARVGLSATPPAGANVVFDYTLRQAVSERFVKTPIIATRSEGYDGGKDQIERDKLSDGLGVLKFKSTRYQLHEQISRGARDVNPVMLVACEDISHATRVTEILRSTSFLGSESAVLQVDSANMSEADEAALAAVQSHESPVRAVVNVNMLNAGWDVNNVAVLVPLRALTSATLTEQMIGRGLRLPYGRYTDDPVVDSLDIIGHDSMFEALRKAGLKPSLAQPTDSTQVDQSRPADESDDARRLGDTTGSESDIPLDESVSLQGGEQTGDVLVDTAADLGGALRDLGLGGERVQDDDEDMEPVAVRQVRGDEFSCPTLTRRAKSVMFDVDTIKKDELAVAAGRVGTDFSETIDRVQLYTGARADQLNIESPSLDEDAVQGSLTRTVLKAAMMLQTQESVDQAADVSADFLGLCADGEWNGPRLASAMFEMKELVTRLRKDAEARKTVELSLGVVIMPVSHGTLVDRLVEESTVLSARDCDSRVNYTGWERGMFNAARFDAFDTEMQIARMIDQSASVDWWVRVYGTDNVRIQYPRRGVHPGLCGPRRR